MTGPDNNGTRPISVAELLAKNGTIGSPPVGGRRRRRRGNSDAVTVAELTGEIPILRTGELPVVEETTEPEPEPDAEPESQPEPEAEVAPEPEPEPEPVAEDTAPPERRLSGLERASEPIPRRDRNAGPERSHDPRPLRSVESARASTPPDAELMSPDPVDELDEDADALDVDITEEPGADLLPDELGLADVGYHKSESGALFGGDTMADERARGGSRTATASASPEALDEADLREAFDEDLEAPSRGRQILHGLVIALESVLAVVFGAGLFLAFDQLWKWNSLVAMVLAILATLGLVAGVWVVRKTEDIASTLIAVGVGLLVTFGPLALMHAN